MKIFQEAKARSLMDMYRRPTSYEVCAYVDGKAIARLGFSQRKTKSALLSLAKQHSEYLLEHINKAGQDNPPSYTKATGWRFGNLTIAFSGETERTLTEKV